MHYAIIITTPDFAGLNIKEQLCELYPFNETGKKFEGYEILEHVSNSNKSSPTKITLYTTNERCISCEDYDKKIDADIFIFPTTHRSAAGTHSLCVHVQGNWGNADLGGIPCNLSVAHAPLLKEFFKVLHQKASHLDEEITMEATHHGPRIEKPTVFLEIGSDESQWKRADLGKMWADVIMDVVTKEIPPHPSAIGIGGTHYCANLNKIQLGTDIAIGHVCAKYALASLTKEMLVQAIEKTIPRPELAILDWKALGTEKDRIIEILDEIGFEWKKTKDMK